MRTGERVAERLQSLFRCVPRPFAPNERLLLYY